MENDMIAIDLKYFGSRQVALLKKALKVIGIILLIIIVVSGIMLFSLSRGLKEGASLEFGDLDLESLEDGVYHGRYENNRWTNEVEVTVVDHRITDIKLVSDVQYGGEELANQLFDAVIREQSVKVDAISGATVTANAYLKAIENALLSVRE
jgi:uncharacterized protein with FMN-binding domain